MTPEELAAHPDVRRMVRYQARRALQGRALPITEGDLEADALTAVWQWGKKLTSDRWASFAWIAARWAIQDRIKHELRFARRHVTLDAAARRPLPEDPEARLMARHDAYAALASLTRPQAEVVSDMYWWGLSLAEVAAKRGVSESAVKHMSSRALKRMRAELVAA